MIFSRIFSWLLLISSLSILAFSNSAKRTEKYDVATRWKVFFEKSFDKFLISMKTNMENIYYYGNNSTESKSLLPLNPFTVVQYCLQPINLETFKTISKAHSVITESGHQFKFLYYIPESKPYSDKYNSNGIKMLQDYFSPEAISIIDVDDLKVMFGSLSTELIDNYNNLSRSSYSRAVFVDALALYAHLVDQMSDSTKVINASEPPGYTWFLDSSITWSGDLSRVLARWDDDADISVVSAFASSFTAPMTSKMDNKTFVVDYAAAGCVGSTGVLSWSTKQQESSLNINLVTKNPFRLAINGLIASLKKVHIKFQSISRRIKKIFSFGNKQLKPKSSEVISTTDTKPDTVSPVDEEEEVMLCMSEISRYSPRLLHLIGVEFAVLVEHQNDNAVSNRNFSTAATVAIKHGCSILDLLELGLTENLLSTDFVPSLFDRLADVSTTTAAVSTSDNPTDLNSDEVAEDKNNDSDQTNTSSDTEADAEAEKHTDTDMAPTYEWPFLAEPLTEAFQRLSERFIIPTHDQEILNWKEEVYKNITQSLVNDNITCDSDNISDQDRSICKDMPTLVSIIDKLKSVVISHRYTSQKDFDKVAERFSSSALKLEAQLPRIFAQRPGMIFRNVIV